MMRIVYDHQIFDIQAYGGISRYCYEIAKNISTKPDTDVEIFAPLYQNNYLINAPASLHITGFSFPTFKGARRLARVVNNSIANLMIPSRKADIYHETYYQAKSPKPRGAVTVLTIYDMIHEIFPTEVSDDGTQAIKRAAVARADHIICISKNTKKDLVNILGVDQNKISVVLLGIGALASAISDGDTIGELSGKSYILYVGQRSGYKNFDCLLQAFAETAILRNEFRIVCFGGGTFNDNEREKINIAGLNEKSVIQLGGNDDFLWSTYANAAAFVYPSLYEGFGIPPLEAMRAGCPVICSNSSSLPEVVDDAALLFNPMDTCDLAEKIVMVVSNLEFKQKLIEKGLQRVKLFSWEKTANETFKIYQQLVNC